MKLLRIRLKDYRGIDEHEVEPDPEGVTIIEGPNEVGKSSMAEALDLIFERKDRSRANEVDDVVPVDRDVGPEIEVEMTTGPYRFTYRKRFRKDAATELTIHEPTPENLTGDEAHDRALEILEETLDTDLWRALRVQQGTEVSQADLTDQTALSKALDQAAGGARIGDEEMALFDAVEDVYSEFWTSTGNRRKAYREEIDAVEGDGGLEEQVAELERRYRELEDDVERSRTLEEELEETKAQLPELEERQAEWADKLAEIDRLDQALAKAKAEEETARERLKSAKQALGQRQALIETVEQAQEARETAQDALDEERPALERVEAAHETARDALEEAREAHKEAKATERLRRRDLEHLRQRQELGRLAVARERAEEARAAAKDARETLAALQVDDALIDALTQVEMEIGTLTDRLEEQGPTVRLTAETELTVEVDGQARDLADDETLEAAVAERLTLDLPEVAHLEIDAGRSTEEIRQALEEASSQRDRLLEDAGVDDLAGAREANHQRRQADQALDRASEQLEQALDGRSLEDLEDAVASLEAQVEAYPDQRPDEPALPTRPEEAQPLHREAEQALEAAEQGLEDARLEHEQAQEALEGQRDTVRELSFKAEAAEQDLAEARQQLEAAREEVADDELEDALDARQAELAEAEGVRKEAEAALQDANPEAVRAQADNATQVLERTRREVRQLEKELEGLRGSLRAREQEGLHEKLEHKRAELAHARRDLEALRRRAQAAKLLYEAMEEERSEARQAYVGPLREEIERLGRIVYGDGFQVTMDEDLTLQARTFRGRTVPYDSLSVGAKEQLSILGRLACATIVAEDGGVPLLLDDALGYSDPSRLEAMGAVLATAGKDCQVIVMTCMPDRYRHVGSAKIERLG